MFDKDYETRLQIWHQFRKELETAEDPIKKVFEFYDQAQLVSIQADPWDQSTWPSPWELLKENFYCPFVKILAICYTLQLTERFSTSHFEIHITQDEEKSQINYLLILDDWVFDQNGKNIIQTPDLDDSITTLKNYVMPNLH